MKTYTLIALVIATLASSVLSDEKDPNFDPRISELVSQNVLQLANDIGKEVIKQKPAEKSVVFSPLSIFAVLSSLQLGSKGKTYDELMRLLKYGEGKPMRYERFRQKHPMRLRFRPLFSRKSMESARGVRSAAGRYFTRLPQPSPQKADVLGHSAGRATQAAHAPQHNRCRRNAENLYLQRHFRSKRLFDSFGLQRCRRERLQKHVAHTRLRSERPARDGIHE